MPRSCDVGSVHIRFYVDDIDMALARVSETGWGASSGAANCPGEDRRGMRLIYLGGPDRVHAKGARWQLIPARILVAHKSPVVIVLFFAHSL